jgi:hypothetical protein
MASVASSSERSLRLDDAIAGGNIQLTANSGSIASNGAITTQQLGASAGMDIALNDVTTTADLMLATSGGTISGNSFTSDGAIGLNARDGITLTAATAGSDLALTSQGGIVLGTGSASGDISIRTQPTGSSGARPDVTIDALTAGRDIDLEAGALTLGTLVSGRDTSLAADTVISLASAQAGDDFVANGSKASRPARSARPGSARMSRRPATVQATAATSA